MDKQNETQEFDLDEILNEFHETEAEAPEEVEPDQELEELLNMPELTITPVVIRQTDIEELMPQEAPEAALEGDTLMFRPITDTQIQEALETGEVPHTPVPLEDTQAMPVLEPQVTDRPTEKLEELSQLHTQPQAAPKAEPAFDVEEEFIPASSIFQSRSQLKELKKELVSGPEKRYYALSEVGTGRLQLAVLLSAVLVLLCAGLTALYAENIVPENRLRLVIYSQVLGMMLSALLGSHLMLDSIAELLRGRFTVNTLLTITFGVCMADALLCLKELRIPCCAAFSLEMTMALWARLQRRNTEMSQLDTMRKAVRLQGVITADACFEGKAGILRTKGQVSDFMETYDKTSSPELVQSIFAGLSLAACLGIAGFAGYRHGLSMGLQILSTALLVAVPASFFVSTTRPMAVLERRLHMVGTVLCGWEGVKDLCGKAVVPITDKDLFPQGSTKLNGVKFYGDRTPDQVVSYTTALITRAGGGLVPVFRQLLKSRNGIACEVEHFQSYGDRGIGGEVCGEPVLVGTLHFLQDMGVEIPEGTTVNQAIYASIDGQLSGVYAISYTKMRSASAGLLTLCGYRKLTILKMPGDFMLTEDFLRTKFCMKTKRIRFLDRETAAVLDQFQPDPQEPVLALLTREDLMSAAYAISGAKALRQATKLGVLIHMLGGVLGMAIMLVLAYLGSTELLTPVNILLYQLIWALPGLLITEWTRVV